MALRTDYKIPQRLVVGYRKAGGTSYAYPTEIRISNRTKNSAFKIEKEASWKNKIDDRLPKRQVKNEFRDGFTLSHYNIQSFSRSGNRANWYLYHEDYQGQIQITPENLHYFHQECAIEKGVIKEKLIYDGKEFITEATVKERMGEADGNADDLVAIKAEFKERKVLARNLVPGMVYEEPPSKRYPNPNNWLIYLGKVKVANGDEYFVSKKVYKSYAREDLSEGHMKDYAIGNHSYSNTSNRETVRAPGSILSIYSDNGHHYTRGNASQTNYTYKGHKFKTSSYSRVKYSKTLPAQYTPRDDAMHGEKKINEINIYKGYGEPELDMMEFLLLNNNFYAYGHVQGVQTDAVTAARAALEDND